MPNVDIPGVGVVEFPDSMSTADIQAAAQKAYQQNQGATAAGPTSPGREQFNRFLPPALLAGASVGAGLGLDAASKLNPNLPGALGHLALEQLPFSHAIGSGKRFMERLQGPPPVEAAKSAAKPKGKVPSKPIKVQGKPEARVPVPTEDPKYTGGRGASGPKLAERARQLEVIRGGSSLPERAAPQIPPAADLEDQLRRSITLAQLTRNAAPEQGMMLRKAVGAALPPALEALTFILGAQGIPQQMEEARRQYLQGTNPELYRMLYENPNNPFPSGI